MAEHAREELVNTFKRHSGAYSDFTITCGSDTYNVHKAVVCTRSEFFKGAERFAVNQQQAASAKADLSEDDPHIVKRLVKYLYEGDYDAEIAGTIPAKAPSPVVTAPSNDIYHYDFPHTCRLGCELPDYLVCNHHIYSVDSCGSSCVDFVCLKCCPDWTSITIPTAGASQLLLHAKMYEMGDKYDVKGLKDLARVKFTSICTPLWNDEVFAQAADHALNTTPDTDVGLREVIRKTIVAHIELLNKPEIAALLSKHTGFMFGVLRRVAEEKAGLQPVTGPLSDRRRRRY
ncbi:hypothetical protein J4E90_004868 [Alternaria incomplexa]|uniref:uncharacterized protein n=1 Tax=Alternaria incomplexa TaxID=1187928 RepID=UPI00221FD855|nr:uncharacterized protein J4E90_004868 [Alternaria incomplexa]KAI4914834.1 hypothetical protein J4E90_004868 [Alternaria incomplexa]